MVFERADLTHHIIDDLVDRRFSVQPNALSPAMIQALREAFQSRRSDFRPAKIGRTGETLAAPEIRNDSICWMEEDHLRPAEAELFQFFENLRQTLNRELFLGLTDFEAHYASYEKGHFYKRHLDQFQTDGARRISVVLYLNQNWSAADGGVLRLYAPETPETIDVAPNGGTLVAFSSSEIEHEVLVSHRERMSLAAWFRRS